MHTAKKFTTIAGMVPEQITPYPPFSPLIVQFCKDFSRQLQSHPLAKDNPSWAAFSFWLRPRKVEEYKSLLPPDQSRLGRGLTFHIAPANMPVMFLYSLFISLLAGNANVVRISPKLLPNVVPICSLFDRLLQTPSYRSLWNQNAIITYDHEKKVTDKFSKHCDSRIIWGGDNTICEIRKSPLSPRAIDIPFSDRYSLAIFDSSYVATCSDEELKEKIHRFYLDTYEVDQNACSSPRLIFWLGPDRIFKEAQSRWWNAVTLEIQKYDLAPIKVSRKFTEAWRFAMHEDEIQSVAYDNNRLYVYTLSSLPADLTQLSGTFGQFFQYPVQNLSDILPYLTAKVQTITTFNVSPTEIRSQLIQAQATGVDRIVPIGQAMDMDIIWDGRNLLEALTRIIR